MCFCSIQLHKAQRLQKIMEIENWQSLVVERMMFEASESNVCPIVNQTKDGSKKN